MNIGTLEKIGPYTSSIEIEFTAEEFEAAVNNIYLRDRGKIQIPGFRKGKATRKLIESYYGEDTFYNDAINNLLTEQVPKIVDDNDIDLVDAPSAKEATVTDDKSVKAVVEFTTKPEITLPDYKGLRAPKIIEAITDENVNEALEREREKKGAATDVIDRPAQTGDDVNIDFEGFLDGVAFDGGAADKFDLRLGSSSFIPGFEEQVAGHSVGEEFDINVTFPEDYNMETLAGKDVIFKIKLNKITAIEYPELDDDFANDVSEFNTLEEFKADIRRYLEESAEIAADRNFENYLIDELLKGVEGEIPECMFKQRIDALIREFAFRLKHNKTSIEQYLSYTGQDIEELRAQYYDRAVDDVKVRLALDKIIEDEKLEISDEEFEEEYRKLSETQKIPADKLEQYVPRDLYRKDLLSKKAIELIKEHGIVDNTLTVDEETDMDDIIAAADETEE